MKIKPDSYCYRAMIGVGGIGAGTFFALNGNHTLGREESRGGHFLDRRDYCKLHIICHYVQTLLGGQFITIPVGKVGSDEVGERLLSEMEEAGLEMGYVQRSPGDRTLFSFCFVYPDGSGGNMTTDDSVCSKVDASFVAEVESEFRTSGSRSIALAVPEVPLEAREALLDLGTRYGSFRVASFTSEEMPAAAESGMLRHVDLLAVNLHEAGAVLGADASGGCPHDLARAAAEALTRLNPGMLISITGGASGSWTWDGAALSHMPVYEVPVVSTAGAGDTHLAGVIVGLAAGLPLSEAQQLGALVAAMSVTSPHTIDKRICRESLYTFSQEYAPVCSSVRTLLED